jgi:RHH-type proline utilization regulon transcriptional repressor/proline dehydrogenase/delta 1-pyrroline-5-carboxylate dehydrogenase
LILSIPPEIQSTVAGFLASIPGRQFLGDTQTTEQSDKDLIAIIPEVQRIRYAAPDRVPDEVFRAAAKTGFYISRSAVTMEGRLELLQYLKEQSICNNYHRYGNLGERA